MLNPALARSLGSRSWILRPASSSVALLHNVNGKKNAHSVDNAANDSKSMAQASNNDTDHTHNAANAPRSMLGGTRTQRAEREQRENTNSHLPPA